MPNKIGNTYSGKTPTSPNFMGGVGTLQNNYGYQLIIEEFQKSLDWVTKKEINVKLDMHQRLILANQYLILEKLYPLEEKFYKNHRIVFENGFEAHYSWATEHILDPLSAENSRFVLDVLAMYSSIYFAVRDSDAFDFNSPFRFEGFDGNDETKLLIYCRYFVHDLDRYQELKYGDAESDFNSHKPTLDMYRRQLERWRSIGDRIRLTKDQAEFILGIGGSQY